jgi:predicted transcriptional regulator
VTDDAPPGADGRLTDLAALLARLDRQGAPWTVDTLRLIEKYPGVHTAALARRAGERPAEINSRLRRLADAGVIERGDGLGHRLSALGVALLQSAG